MIEGVGAGITYAIRQNQREFDKLALELRKRIEITQKSGDIETPLHVGMIVTMNAVMEEIREIEEGVLPRDQARLSSTTTGEHRIRRFQEEAKAISRNLSDGKFELEFKHRDDLHKALPTTMHGSSISVKLKRVK